MRKGSSTLVSLVAVIVTGVVIFLLATNFMDRVEKSFVKAGDKAVEIAQAFKKGTIVTIWKDYVTQVSGSNYLQVAKLNSVETFTRTDSTSAMWDMIDLPDVIVQLETPVEFTFYLNLNDQWQFKWDDSDQGVTIIAPKIQYNQPAVDISKMSFTTIKGSVLRNEKKVQDQFMQDITTVLSTRVGEKINLIREIARNETSKFFSNWFINVVFKDASQKPYIKAVYFADEKSQDTPVNNPP